MKKKYISIIAVVIAITMVFAIGVQAASTVVSLSLGEGAKYSATLGNYKTGAYCGRNNAASTTKLYLTLYYRMPGASWTYANRATLTPGSGLAEISCSRATAGEWRGYLQSENANSYGWLQVRTN